MAGKKKKKNKTSKDGSTDQSQVIAENRRARHKYEILQQIECGVMLIGSEAVSYTHLTLPTTPYV